MPIESAPNSSEALIAWNEIARACRRICLLRERGDHAEAERVRTGQLPPLLSAARTPADTDEGIALRLEALMAREAERVADAAVLADLLQSLLPELPRPPTGSPRAASGAIRPAAFAAEPAKPRPAPVSIADFIDTMLEQDDGTGSSRPAPHHRRP